MLISLSGIEGAGKSTLAAGLCERLSEDGHHAVVLKLRMFNNPAYHHFEPLFDHGAGVEDPRVPRLQSWLITTETVRFVREDVWPQVLAGTIVIADRYADSVSPYLAAAGLPCADSEDVLSGLPAPTVACHLKISTASSVQRRKRIGEQVTAAETTFLDRLGAALAEKARHNGGLVLDAEKAPGTLLDDVYAELRPLLSKN